MVRWEIMDELSTRDKILKEAESRFVEAGITGTQMKEIAEAAGINRRTLYRYFPTKEELAFAVEVAVIAKLHLEPELKTMDMEGRNGFEKVSLFFETVSLVGLEHLIRYTAEFDSYFRDEYPSQSLEEDFIARIDPERDSLYSFVREGWEDGSIRNDLSPLEIFMFVNQNFLGFFQRLILREKHLEKEHCANLDFNKLFRKIILQGIRRL